MSTFRLRRIGRRLLDRLPSGLVLPVLRGRLAGARWLMGAGSHGHWLGTYEPELQDLLWDLLQPGDICFDVGAHVGYHTLLASRRVGPTGRVVAFEPLPENVRWLRRHLALNRATNVTVVEAAVSNRVGSAALELGANRYVARLGPEGTIRVRVVTLDAYAAQEEIWPRLIKIDVEGEEVRALGGAEGLCRRRQPIVVVSVHAAEQVAAVTDLLTSWGYRVTDVRVGPEAACLLAVR